MWIDKTTFRKTGSKRKGWLLSSYFPALSKGYLKPVASNKALMLFNCEGRSMATERDLNYSGLAGEGDVLSTSNYSTPLYREVVPDTVGETMLKNVCTLK